MAKVTGIDLSDDRLIAIAADMVDDHNYISALKMLNKNAGITGNDEDSLMLYAEIFDDLGLYEKCVNGWFRYLDESTAYDLSECYEGLAVAFMNLGDEHFSAYYYNKLLAETDDLDDDEREEIISDFITDDDNPLKFVYPPALADCSDVVSKGVDYMKEGDFDRAVEEFDKVEAGNPKYLSARNYVAMCKIISDKCEEAEEECLSILKAFPDDVQALTTLAAVKTEAGKPQEAEGLAKKLLTLDVKNDDDIYKIATVCCENKLHAEAYGLFCRLSDEFDYNLNVLYFKAVSAFNCGKYEESFTAFDTLCTIYPEAVTARFYFNLARESHEKGEEKELSYFYRLPAEVRESTLKVLAVYSSLSRTAAKKLVAHLDLSDCVRWCFDEIEAKNGGELRALAAQAAIKADLDGIVRELLLDAFMDDRIKIEMLASLVERNVFDLFGVVICNVYKRVSVQPLSIGKIKRKNFLRAYGKLVSHFSIIDDEFGGAFGEAAERLYDELTLQGRIDEAKNDNALAAAIYFLSGVSAGGIEGGAVYDFFGADKKITDKLIGGL